MKRILGIIFLLIGISFNVLAETQGADKFRIGAILPLTGGIAVFGDNVNKALNLAYSQLPKEIQDKVEIIIEDDSFNSARALSAYQKLVATQKIDALIVVGSPSGNVLAPLVEQKKIPMIDVGASDQNIVKDRKYTFIHWVSPAEEGKAFVAEIKRRGYQRIAIIRTEHPGLNAVYDGITEYLKVNGLENIVVLEEEVPDGETNFATFVAKVRAKKVDGIVPLLFSGMLSSFARKVREQKIDVDMFSIEIFEDSEVVKDAAGALDNQWYATGDDGNQELIDAYQAKYNQYPGWGVSNAVDSFNLLIEGFKKFGNNSEKMVEYLSSVKDFHGTAGVYSATGTQCFSLPSIIKVVRKDGFRKLQK